MQALCNQPLSTDPVQNARAALEQARRQIAAEIASYPMPISGCDAQFNHLLAQRLRLTRAIAALDAPAIIPTSRNPDPAGV